MTTVQRDLTDHLLERLRQVREQLGQGAAAAGADTRFADALDSMGLVEFLVTVADDCGVTPAALERCVERRFGTVGELAAALQTAGLLPGNQREPERAWQRQAEQIPCWLAATVACLPRSLQPAAVTDEALGRPPGWLEEHAGIRGRRIWGDQDPLAIAADAGLHCLRRAGLLIEQVGALLVTAEAPPVYPGLAAALHHRLELRPDTVALEIGGACTGFLAALWTGRALLPRVGVALLVAVEAPTRWLTARPGAAGEAAALFGEAAAASVLCQHPTGPEAVAVAGVVCGVDGSGGALLRVGHTEQGALELRLDGEALAARAVRAMADAVRGIVADHGLKLAELEAVLAHGGNGRMPALLARQLDVPPEKVWSTVAETGNLGAASLPVTWAGRRPAPQGPVVWTAIGAGLTWGAALTGIG